VLALHQQLPIGPVIRTSIGVNLTMDGLLLALAPVFAVIALHSIALVGLLLVTVWVIYHSATLALRNRHEATHDLLTGIPNRRHFDDQAALCISGAREGGRVAVVQVDLNGFKAINDRLGHHYGDLVLREVANRLNAAKRPSDLIARFGGDEFAILMRDVAGQEAAEAATRRFHDALVPTMTVDGLPLSVRGSFGVAVFPDDGEDIDTLLHNADMAMYRAKSAKAGVRLFEPSDAANPPAAISLLSELSAAMAGDEPFLVYQPRIEVGSGRVLSTIARSMIELAHNLGLRTVAEGVENPEEIELLAAMGCEAVQGYLLVRPAVAEDLDELLRGGRVEVPKPVPATGAADRPEPSRIEVNEP
jgi:diguanylate cyclase (GGDEF)-like protein